MPQNKLYSIAAIAKMLDVPESTMHYWKNRFDSVLPSVGQGRHKRFRSDAVEMFREIARLLEAGLGVADVKVELASTHPVDGAASGGEPLVLRALPVDHNQEELALRIGTSIAEALGERLRDYLHPPTPASLPTENMDGLKVELGQTREHVEALRAENQEMARKLSVLEAELVRLRKDGREMEKHLLEKIKTAGK